MMEPKKRKYYDKDETDDYLELVMEQYKQLYDENLELQKNVKSLNDGVQYYRSIENTMQKALVLAEKTAKETKDAAQLKAEAIEKDANTKADKIVAEAVHEVEQDITDTTMNMDAEPAPTMPVDDNPNRTLSPEEIAALFASMQ